MVAAYFSSKKHLIYQGLESFTFIHYFSAFSSEVAGCVLVCVWNCLPCYYNAPAIMLSVSECTFCSLRAPEGQFSPSVQVD